MTVVQKIDRRQAQRFQAAFNIRFSINGGPEILSNTLNFTSRSLAIRSDVKADKGDRVSVFFGGLPAIDGEVVRVFPEGFAVVLSEASLAMKCSPVLRNSNPVSGLEPVAFSNAAAYSASCGR